MRKVCAALLVALVLSVSGAFAAGDMQNRPIFFGDGFDNTTCADLQPVRGCP